MAMMICPNCGEKNITTMRVCKDCGKMWCSECDKKGKHPLPYSEVCPRCRSSNWKQITDISEVYDIMRKTIQ